MYIRSNSNDEGCGNCGAGVRAPGFGISLPFLEGQVGAGDLVGRLTRAAGLVPCSSCEERRRWLNQQLYFRPWGDY